jgi:hypothetical protein
MNGKREMEMTAERTWEISDLDGSNKRTVTLAQYKAELAAAKAAVAPIVAAFKRGDMAGMAAAQASLWK